MSLLSRSAQAGPTVTPLDLGMFCQPENASMSWSDPNSTTQTLQLQPNADPTGASLKHKPALVLHTDPWSKSTRFRPPPLQLGFSFCQHSTRMLAYPPPPIKTTRWSTHTVAGRADHEADSRRDEQRINGLVCQVRAFGHDV